MRRALQLLPLLILFAARSSAASGVIIHVTPTKLHMDAGPTKVGMHVTAIRETPRGGRAVTPAPAHPLPPVCRANHLTCPSAPPPG